ncbi:MAG: phosphatase PAP2 family protein [Hyphomicrobium sp.]
MRPAAVAFTDDISADTRFRRDFLIGALLIGSGFAFVFLTWPEIDLAVSEMVRSACAGDDRNRGWCTQHGVLWLPRWLGMIFSALCIAASVAMVVRAVHHGGRWIGRDQARAAILLATFIAGPGVLANLILKEHWGRARPREIVEFGGSRQFTPALVPAAQCSSNCSFVSGEAASVYAPFFATALLVPQARVAFIAGGIAAGSAAGLVRMGQGGHFLSDIVFAGVFMAITASLMHILLVGLWSRPRNAASRRRHGRPAYDGAFHMLPVAGAIEERP